VSGRNRLGGGATVHFAPNFSCDAFGVCNSNVSLDTAVGAIVQWAYCIRPREDIGVNLGLELGLRASYIKYSGSGVEPLNGSNAGLFFGFWF
jgi:hypothetical protein